MARYLDEAAATADGIHIVYEPEAHRFALYQDAAGESSAGNSTAGESSTADTAAGSTARELIGEAHYSFPVAGTVDFDHTVVDPKFRGTGLSGLLAHHAVTSEVAQTHHVQASCWFIHGYLAKHPELLAKD